VSISIFEQRFSLSGGCGKLDSKRFHPLFNSQIKI
jgi:hypothetical protein